MMTATFFELEGELSFPLQPLNFDIEPILPSMKIVCKLLLQ